jgi:hypothetical protein
MRHTELKHKPFILLNLARRQGVSALKPALATSTSREVSMVAASLAGARLLRNNITEDDNISRLTQFFYRLFKHYCSYSTFPVVFIQALRTLAGLDFTACLIDEAYISSYQSYFNCFLNDERGDFRKSSQCFMLSKPMANKADGIVQL